MSGFNKVDFSVILNAVMQQESLPLRTLEGEQSTLSSQSKLLSTLATKLTAAQGAAANLNDLSAFSGRSVTSTDSDIATVAAGAGTPIGTYDIVVNELARAQVTGSNSAHTDKDTTVVASLGDTLTLGGIAVSITGDLTLQGLADAINATDDSPVTASIVSPSAGTFQLVLTGNETGTANSVAIADGVSGVSFAANVVDATDASVMVNGIQVSSPTNSVTDAIPGATITLLKKSPATTVTATVAQDLSITKTRIKAFVTAYNDLITFAQQQSLAALGGDQGSIGRDGVLRAARNAFSQVLTAEYNVGGTYAYGSEVGVSFDKTGALQFDEAAFDTATKNGTADVSKLFIGSGGSDGLFKTFEDALTEYVQAGGLVPEAQTRLTAQIASIDVRIEALAGRLAVRRAALQREYISYDQTIARLNSQAGALNNLASSLF